MTDERGLLSCWAIHRETGEWKRFWSWHPGGARPKALAWLAERKREYDAALIAEAHRRYPIN